MQDVKLLQASVVPGTDSEFRILLNGQDTKYLTIASHVYEVDDMCFEPALTSILPPLPPGNWTTGHISRNNSGQPQFIPSDRQLPGIDYAWHSQSIEYLNLSIGRKIRSNVYETSHPTLHEQSILEFARFPWEIPLLDAETRAYSWIIGQDFCPKFLGQVTENNRIIGFVIEQIKAARTATPVDLERCQQSLLKLHKLNIRHGDVNQHNFLIKNQKTFLVDFDEVEPVQGHLSSFHRV